LPKVGFALSSDSLVSEAFARAARATFARATEDAFIGVQPHANESRFLASTACHGTSHGCSLMY
jgi:hypothetical protein